MNRRKLLVRFLVLGFCFFCHMTYSPATTIHTHDKFIAYTDVGHGKPLLLVHAFPTDKRLWAPQQEELKKHFRVITLDLWGFGESSSVDGNAVTMDDYADEIKLLLEHLQLQKVIIAGESMGGYIALAFLEKYSQQVDGLVLSNTQAIADNPETKVLREKTAMEVLAQGPDNFIQNFMTKALSFEAAEQNKAFLHHILTMQKSTAIASALRGMAQRNDHSQLLVKTTCPILVITSDQDRAIAPKQSEDMHALAQNSQLVVLVKAGHLSNLEQPQQWNQAVIDRFAAD
ncbi:alpha/beta fold hydrolase [Legionella cardiaca]|uniref:Alpha/beta hydrolase n=1 Tax=Legionella cardiaca TaxID=1071983 RepID=A0ABY8AQH9_9GAMM|nr:alpha/beta hydrolase [Legionella cardiaca]WED42950.1 alpha/beta hydrolase [Legionella cardiaca]